MISILYAEGAAFSAILLFLILLRTNSIIEFSYSGKIFKILIICSFFFCLIDSCWGIVGCYSILKDKTLFTIITYLFYLCSSLIAMVWFLFSLKYLGERVCHKFGLKIIPYFLLAFEFAIIISGYLNDNMFFISDKYEYITLPMRTILFFSQFLNYFAILIVAIYCIVTEKDSGRKLYSENTIIFSIISMLTNVGQLLLPSSPIYSVGFATSVFIIFAYIITHENTLLLVEYQNQKNEKNYQEKLKADFSVLSCLSGYYELLALIDNSDANMKILNASDRVKQILKYDDPVISGPEFDVLLNKILKKEDIQMMVANLGREKAVENLMKVQRMTFDFMASFDGKNKCQIRIYLAMDKDNINQVVLGIRDTTDEYHLEQQIENQKKMISNLEIQNEMTKMIASTDGLTGLSNKLTFIEEVESYLARNSSENCALIFFDMDHFKKINDLFGHNTGDDALREMAKKLRTLFRSDEMIGRMGGDEFCIFLPLISKRLVEERIKQMNKTLIAEYSDKDNKIKTSASIGCAYCESKDKTYVEMHSVADKAMYEVKRKGRNNSVIKVI